MSFIRCFPFLIAGLTLTAAEPLRADEAPASWSAVGLTGEKFNLGSPRLSAGWKVDGVKGGTTITLDAQDLVSIRFAAADQQPIAPKGAQVLFPTGEVLIGDIKGTDGDHLRLSNPHVGEVSIPLGRVQGIVMDPDASEAQVRTYAAKIGAKNRQADQVFLKNGDMIVGVFQEIVGHQVKLERDGKPVSLARDLVAAIAFDPSLVDYKATADFYGQLRLLDGSVINVTNGSSDDRKLAVQAAFGATIDVERDGLADLSFRNGRVAYLSDIEPTKAEAEPFLDDRMEHRLDRSVLGTALKVDGQTYAKGIGVRSHSVLTYALANYERFEAVAGLDAQAGSEASVRFRVEVDGKKAFDSGEMTSGSGGKRVDVSVAGAKELKLIVEYASRGDVQDFADWCDARLVR